jgi:hypothetical protein
MSYEIRQHVDVATVEHRRYSMPATASSPLGARGCLDVGHRGGGVGDRVTAITRSPTGGQVDELGRRQSAVGRVGVKVEVDHRAPARGVDVVTGRGRRCRP